MSAVARRRPGSGRPIKRKEDPRLIMGRARYIDDINVTGQLWAAFVRSPEAHAKIVSIDTSAAQGLPGRARRLHRPRPRPRGAAADGLGPAGDRRQQPAALGDRQGRGPPRRRPRRAGDRLRPLRAWSTPPSRCWSSTTRCRWSIDIETALEDGADLVHAELGTNKSPRVVAGRRGSRGRLRGRRRDRRAAGGQPPHGGRGDRAARRAGRLPRRLADAHLEHPGPALPAAVPRRSSWGSARSAIRAIAPEVGGGFGSKLQIYGEEIALAWASRKLERPIKWVESRTEGMLATHHGRDQVAYVKIGATRDGKITAFHTKILPGPRRLPDAADADDPVAGRVRDERRLRHPGGPDRHHRRLHEQDADRRDPRGRAAPRRRT